MKQGKNLRFLITVYKPTYWNFTILVMLFRKKIVSSLDSSIGSEMVRGCGKSVVHNEMEHRRNPDQGSWKRSGDIDQLAERIWSQGQWNDGRSKRRQFTMFDRQFDRLLLRILKTTSTKLGRFQNNFFYDYPTLPNLTGKWSYGLLHLTWQGPGKWSYVEVAENFI